MKARVVKHLMSLTVRCAVCVVIYLLMVGMKIFLPEAFGFIENALEKSIDVNEAARHLVNALKETALF